MSDWLDAKDLKRNFAPWWGIWLARLFGKRIEDDLGDVKIVSYRWRGKIYIISMGEK